MYNYVYQIIAEDGYCLLDIKSAGTNLSYDEYLEKHISPLLPVIAKSHGEERAYVYVEEIE